MLPETKRPNEVGQTGNPKSCLYHQLINYSTEDCFVLKGKIQYLINSGSISLPDDSVKASVHQVSITEDMLEEDES